MWSPTLDLDVMTQSPYTPVDAVTATRDRTRSALLPTLAVTLLLVGAMAAVAYPVAAGLATAGLGGAAVAVTARR
jgi:hypothetical protein